MQSMELLTEVQQRQFVLDQICTAWNSEQQQRGNTTYCRKGCSGCCSLAVNSTFPEAMLALSALSTQQTDRLKAQVPYLRKAAECSNDLKQWLTNYRNLAGPCPFLASDGSCGIYAVRPLSCRSLISTKAPSWCTTDFSELSSAEKQTYMASLDRTVVAFPTHYAATPQEIGRELEEATLRQTETVYGFSLIGLFPWLIWLEQEYSISTRLSDGAEALQEYLKAQGCYNQFLVALM